ncbi:MAG TPA: LptA/OstA family protein [Terriglobia bacterium]|nr:LptA/OstA family protein [Terriglobia bacterium]
MNRPKASLQTINTKRISSITGAALGTALLAVGAAYWLKSRHAGKAPSAPAALPAGVHQQLSGYTFTRSEGGRQVFTVHAARTVSFKGGAETRLEDVSVDIFGRTGRHHDVLRTASCQYNSSMGGFRCAGKVEVELNAATSSSSDHSLSAPAQPADSWQRGQQTVYLETANLSFQPQGAVLLTDAPVAFRYGAVSGQGIGLEYATNDGLLDLKSNVVLDVPSSDGGPPWRLTAGGLRYTKDSGQVQLRAPVEITAGARKISADRGWILLDGRNRATQAALLGNVRGTDAAPGQTMQLSAGQIRAELDPASDTLRTLVAAGTVQVESKSEGESGSLGYLSADQLRISFSGGQGSPEAPQDGIATGNVKLRLRPASPAAPMGREPLENRASAGAQCETLTASVLRFQFGGAGLNLREAHTVGAGKLVLVPADPRAGERVVTAGQFVMGFGSDGRLKTFKGLQPTHILFEPGRGSPTSPNGRSPVESSSDLLEAKLDSATESVQTLDQTGNVHFVGQDGQATAERAQYSAAAQTLALTGDPRVWNTDTRARASRFVIHLENNTAEALGNVSSTHFGPAEGHIGAHAQAGGDGHAPGALLADDATHVLADRMLVSRSSQSVHYEGHVRAWHGDDVVESPSLDIDGRARRIRSGAGVVTSDLQPASAKAGRATSSDPRAAAKPVTIRADRLEYFDAGREARYQGHVRMQAEDATLEADTLDVFFSSATAGTDARIKRAVAAGHVVVTEPQRRATAGRAEYFAALGKVVLTGGPPAIYDAANGFATGQRLTLFVHDGSLIVDGGAQSPALARHRIAQ